MRLQFDNISNIDNVEIVYDWSNEPIVMKTGENYRTVSKKVTDHIKSCDAVLCIMDNPSRAYRGVFTEIGMALALDKPVAIYNSKDNKVFNYMTSDRIETSLHYQNENCRVFKNFADLISYLENF